MRPRSRLGCLSVILFLALCFSLLFNFALILSKGMRSATSAAASSPQNFSETTVDTGNEKPDPKGAKIALIYLRGIISSAEPGNVGETAVDDLKLQLRQAQEDKFVKAAVLYIDSPGGEVTASDVIYNAVRRFREHKPIVIYMGSLAASGGYYVACGGSYLLANDTTSPAPSVSSCSHCNMGASSKRPVFP